METREKDFFFRNGGWERVIGSGGGGGSSRWDERDDWGLLNAADASVKDLWRVGMWTALEGAVLGRWSARGRTARWANVGRTVGIGSVICQMNTIEDGKEDIPCDSS